MMQQAACQQRRQSQQDAAFRHIQRRRKLRRHLVEKTDTGRQPFHGGGRTTSHRGGTIDLSASALGAGRRRLLRRWRRSAFDCGTIRTSGRERQARNNRGVYRRFFLTGLRTLPARIAL